MDAQKNLVHHPDENLLAAFAEQALAQTERQRVIDHLAACLRCRQMVFLAQEAAPEDGARSPIEQEPPRRARFSIDRLPRLPRLPLWASAAVAVTIVITIPLLATYLWQPQTNLPGTQVTSKEVSPPMPAMSPRAPGADGHASVPVSDRKEESRKVTAKKNSAKPRPERPKTESPVKEVVEEQLQQASGNSGVIHEAGSAGGVTGGVRPPLKGGPFYGSERQLELKPQSAVGVAAAPAILEPAPVQSAQGMVPLKDLNRSPAPALETSFRVESSAVVFCSGSNCIPRPLPAKALAVSTAFSGRTVMALDTRGNLFVSDDQGVHWDRVLKQWAGKAHSLRLAVSRPALDGLMRSRSNVLPLAKTKNSPSDSLGDERPSSPIFELVNDDGQAWSSSDRGVTWTKKAP